MEGEHLPLQHIIDNPLNMQSDDRPATFVGLMEEAIGQMVAASLATGSVAGPAAGRHTLLAVPDSFGTNGDQADILLAQLPAPGVHALCAGPE